MPGTIQVAVLEFKGVSSSSKPSAKSLKVSMGKNCYQTWDKGDFSFPITKLGENLVVTLLDAGGNEIAHSDIRTMQIIEKGSWDEVFSIDGGGNVHMKLQFILSEEERNRIRIVRESAMKKKLETNPNISLRLSETTSSTRDSVETSKQNELKVSDVKIPKVEASQAGSSLNSATSSVVSPSSYQKEGGSILDSAIPVKELSVNTTDRSQGAPSSPGKLGVQTEESPQVHKRVPAEKIRIQPLANVRSDIEEGASSVLSTSKLQDDPIKKSHNQGPPEKTPSSVRKMISAFENTRLHVLPCEVKSPKKAPFVQSQLNRFGKEELLLEDGESKSAAQTADRSLRKFEDIRAGIVSSDIEPSQASKELASTAMPIPTAGKDSNTKDIPRAASREPISKELEKSPVDLMRQSTSETATSSGRMPEVSSQTADRSLRKFEEIRAGIISSDIEQSQAPKELASTVMPIRSAGKDSNTEDIHRATSREPIAKELEKSPVDLMRQSTSETATSSGRIPAEQQSQVIQDSSVAEGSGRERGTGLKSSTIINNEVASNQKPKSLEYYKEECYSAQSSGMWIFPDNTRRLCITTAGKQVTKIVGHHTIEAKARQVKNSSESEVLEKNLMQGIEPKMEKNEKRFSDGPQLGHGSSPDDSSNGLVGQVIKIAVILGFGVLVLLTRQKEPRKKNKEENDNLFTVPDYIDE